MLDRTNNNLRKLIRREEGTRNFPYEDTRGVTTIGIGRNLEAKGLSDEEIQLLFENDVEEALDDARRHGHKYWSDLGDAQQAALTSMRFQLGPDGYRSFRRMHNALERGDTSEAADEMLDSAWHTQTTARCERMAEQLRTNDWQL